jgi:hypothetical protein
VAINQQMGVAQSLIGYITTSIFNSTSRGIVFVNSLRTGQQWAPNYIFYHAKLSSQEQEEAIDSWHGTGSQWIVGTTALLHGVDLPYVDCVIFVGEQWGMMDFVQGAGRAGRRGQESVIYLLHGGTYPTPENAIDTKQMVALQAMTGDSHGCHRKHISTCMDGKAVRCRDLTGAQLCGICDPHHPHVTELDNTPKLPTSHNPSRIQFPSHHTHEIQPIEATTPPTTSSHPRPIPVSAVAGATPSILRQSANLQAQANARAQTATGVAKCLEILSPYCPICWMEGNKKLQPATHAEKMQECSRVGTFTTPPPYNQGYFIWKRSWKFELALKFDTFCAMPTDIVSVHGSHAGANFGVRCPYANIQYSTAWVIFHREDLFSHMAKDLSYTGKGGTAVSDPQSRQAYRDWLCQLNPHKFSWNLMDVFLWGWRYRDGITKNTKA